VLRDELILLFPSQKHWGRARIDARRGNKNSTGQIMRRGP